MDAERKSLEESLAKTDARLAVVKADLARAEREGEAEAILENRRSYIAEGEAIRATIERGLEVGLASVFFPEYHD